MKSLLHYLYSVYDLGTKIKKLKDKRSNPKIATAAIAFSVILGFMLKIRSFNQLDDYLEYNDFKGLVPKKMRLPRIDAIRDSLKCFCLKSLQAMHSAIIRCSIQNKLVQNGTIDGYKVVAIDGVETFESTKKSCANCLTRVINKTAHYFHRFVVATFVGKDPHIIIGFKMLNPKQDSSNKDEGEISAAKRLVLDLSKQFRRFADIIVYDALACNADWINFIRQQFKIHVVVRVKNKRLNIVKVANAAFKNRDADAIWENNSIKISVWEAIIKMDGVADCVRYVKFLKKYKDSRTGKSMYSQICIVTTHMSISLETLHKIARARWEIENNIFHQIKTEWHMDHCFIHDEIGLEAAFGFLVIAFNLMQLFFFRCIKNFRQRRLQQVEVVERIIKELHGYNTHNVYVFDTS